MDTPQLADGEDLGLRVNRCRHQKRNLSQQSARNARVGGLLWGIGHSGAQVVGADEPNSILPGVFFGKGFGDLPDGLAWLRPFAVTGAFVDELPFGATTTALGFGAPSGKAQSILVPTVETLHWGLSLQYSTYYLTSRFTGGPPKDEPLNQFLPLVEFSFDTPRGQNTAATMNPGLAYVAVAWQFAAEVIVPLNREAETALDSGRNYSSSSTI